MKLAIGYLRVSSALQASEGVSLEAQEAKIKAWAELNGYQLIRICRDNGVSGFKLHNRPGAQEAICLACEHKAVLVVYSLSRLCRSTKEALIISERLSKAGADLVSLSEQIDTTSAAGKMIFRIFAVFAEFERDLASERTKAALHHIKSQGKRMGSIDYGYMADKSRPVTKIEDGQERITYPYLVKCPHEQEIRTEIFRLDRLGYSAAKIANRLNEQDDFKPRNGGQWGLTQIKRILRKPCPTQP